MSNFIHTMVLIIAAGAGITAFFFRKGGIYNPSIPDATDPKLAEVLPDTVSATTTPSGANKPTVAQFCNAIALYEGGVGDANHRNNNPGNCRYNPSGYLPMYGAVGKSAAGFAIFKDWATGMLYLNNMIKGMIHKRPNETILQFMTRYAPTSDGNDPIKYSNFIAKQLSVDNLYMMRDLV